MSPIWDWNIRALKK